MKKFQYLEKIKLFIVIRIKQIRTGGYPILLRKARLICCLPFAIFLVAIMRMLYPLILIRFGCINGARIGDLAYYTDIYCNKKFKKKQRKNDWDIFYFQPYISNYHLSIMWKRVLLASPLETLIPLADRLNRLIPGFEKHTVFLYDWRGFRGEFSQYPPHLSFTKKEENFGMKALRKLGIAENASFICIHARDSAYLKVLHSYRDWYYHNYRDCSISNYRDVAQQLAKRGYYVVRMGRLVEKPFFLEHPKIIDYTNSCMRSDFLDIYLSARCKFFISSGSGIDEVPKIFRRPVIYVNLLPLNCYYALSSIKLFIPKKLFLKKEKRFMKFSEMMDNPYYYTQEYEKKSIEFVENTPDEITSLAIEMDERLKGIWKITGEDEQLQQRFWSFFKASELKDKPVSRIGAEFLRQNKHLLE